MSYFQKHYLRGGNQPQNIKPVSSLRARKSPHQPKSICEEIKPARPVCEGVGVRARTALAPRQEQSGEVGVQMHQRGLPGLMLEGDSSMQELLNSSINQFTKYLSDRHPLQQEHEQLVAQNQSLRASLQRLKTIIKQKLENALSKQREQLNAVMQDYVQLITKLLADKEELTGALEQLEEQLADSHQHCEALARAQTEAETRVEEMARQREQHIAKTKNQIDDFLQIIEQYQEEAEQEGREGEQLRQKITQLEGQLANAKYQSEQPSSCHQGNLKGNGASAINPRTQTLLQMLQRAQQQNRELRQELRSGGSKEWEQRFSALQREHEQQFMEYERAMRETLSKKDECIARLGAIIESYRGQRGGV